MFSVLIMKREREDIQKCKWKVELDKKKTLKLILELENVMENKTKNSEGNFYKIIRKNEKNKTDFQKIKLTSEHKLYYFQKDCNKEFIMKMSITEYKKFIYYINLFFYYF